MLKTVEIVPAILTDNKVDYRTQVERINGFTKRVQIDVTDGKFATAPTLDLTNVWWPKSWSTDIHLMAEKPSTYLSTILKLSPSLCILHAEAVEDLTPIFAQLKARGIKIGVALLLSTYPGAVEEYIKAADHVLIFAGQIGVQGAPADMIQMEKISLIRAINPDVEIGWDGGANMMTVRALAHADVDVINVGSALAKAENPAAAYQELIAEMDKSGVVL
ncbi:MAG: hypothetical protein Q4B34_02980 [Candidatus Saccharibacteria bacterium]|nr:hypothetical protein [Candidatus Saccharibacteria bacterium]